MAKALQITSFPCVIISSHWELQYNSENMHHDSDYDLGRSSVLTLSGMYMHACHRLLKYIKVNLLSVFKHDIATYKLA